MDATILRLRQYLQLNEARRLAVKSREDCESFEPFLKDIAKLFALRLAAEKRFQHCHWLAKDKEKALPLPWEVVWKILSCNQGALNQGIETVLANRLNTILPVLFQRIRRVLRRRHQQTPLGTVQQVDSKTVRWLMQQPGYSIVEKAGEKQQIYAAVRKEDHNLLENRILVDLLKRTLLFAQRWLFGLPSSLDRSCDEVRKVQQLVAFCRQGLHLEELAHVTPIHEVPIPNYALQQDPLYRAVWESYQLVVHYNHWLESMWEHHDSLHRTLNTLGAVAEDNAHCAWRCGELWVCQVLDTTANWFELYELITGEFPGISAQTGDVPEAKDETLSKTGCRIIDLLGERLSDVLVYPDPTIHPNATPRLVEFSRPYYRGPTDTVVWVNNILCDRSESDELLRDYFVQLYGRIGGERWVILVPDDWPPMYQERLISIVSSILGSRAQVQLLWRTMAYALGSPDQISGQVGLFRAQETLSFTCHRANGSSDEATFELADDGLLVRHSFLNDQQKFKPGSLAKIHEASPYDVRCFTPNTTILQDEAQLLRGAERFAESCHQQKKSPLYYDEREGLWMVVQELDEHVHFHEIIAYSDRHPGGSLYEGAEDSSTSLLKGEQILDLYLWTGKERDPNGLLSNWKSGAFKAEGNLRVTLQGSGAPGQGVIQLKVMAQSFLKEPVILPLLDLESHKSEKTLNILESEIERSFPPTATRVEADPTCWDQPPDKEHRYTLVENLSKLFNDETPESSAFAFARPKYDSEGLSVIDLTPAQSPLDRLIRLNFFSTDPQTPFIPKRALDPESLKRSAGHIFARLAKGFAKAKTQVIRSAGKDGQTELATWIRLIAWTYQRDNPLFEDARQWCLVRVKEAYTPQRKRFATSPQIFTLCANFCVAPADWQICLEGIRKSLVAEAPFVKYAQEYWRLFYNLMQFNEDFLFRTGLYAEVETLNGLVRGICFAYKNMPKRLKPNAAAKYQNSLLRCILFLLRCRKDDGKRFLDKVRDPENYSLVVQTLRGVRPRTQSVKTLRGIVIHYLNGKGKLNGIPLV